MKFPYGNPSPTLPVSVRSEGRKKGANTAERVIIIHPIKCIHICIKRCKNSDKTWSEMRERKEEKNWEREKQDETHWAWKIRDRKMATNFRKLMIFNSKFEEEEEYNINSLIRNSKKGTNGSCFFLKNKQKKIDFSVSYVVWLL